VFIPSSAFTYSALTGAPFPGSRGYGYSNLSDDHVLPRSVSEAYYQSICPEERRVKLDAFEVCKELGLDMGKDEVKVLAEAWAKKLASMDDSCIDVINHQLFDFWLVSLSLFPPDIRCTRLTSDWRHLGSLAMTESSRSGTSSANRPPWRAGTGRH
jgi:hypothetical protein